MDELTGRLATDQPVAVGGSLHSLEDLRRRVEEIEYVFVKFTETRGGTDLGVSLDRAACDVSAADFDQGSGTIHVEGSLILNGDPVRCIADIDLATLKGTGHLTSVDNSELAKKAGVIG
jgi:core binding factor beta subunit